MRVAIVCVFVLAVPLAASAQSEDPSERMLALHRDAEAADASADYARALSLYREHGERCLAMRTAEIAPGQPCADVARALSRAFELARALGDGAAAEHVTALFVEHLLYAEPRESIRIAYELVRMHLDAGRLEEAELALARWERIQPDPAPGHAILADALRARIALGEGRERRAMSYWRRVDRRYEEERDELGSDGPIALASIREAVAEARLLRAEPFVERFLAVDPPRFGRTRDVEQLWRRVISPWRVRTERRLLLARMELERVYELGSPRHSVIAAARIGQMYRHLAELHESIPLPDEWFRMLLHRGVDHPGYDEALVHLETCVSWAHHHAVAPRWARRCEEGLHALDPQRFPLPDELAGHAEYLPVSTAPPPIH